MKRLFPVATLMFAIAFSNAAFAANPQAGKAAPDKPTFAMVYDKLISATEKEVVDAADAMPEDKFNFAPTLRASSRACAPSPSRPNTSPP